MSPRDPRFRVGVYLTDKTHLLWVERVKRVGSLAPRTKVVVRDCKAHRIEDEESFELSESAVLEHHEIVIPEMAGIAFDGP